ncbi:MAG: hypothetical protein U0R24_06965 [Solirubrobacterales bacterium]
MIPSIEDQRDQIEALPVPEGEEESISSITDALDQAIDDAKSDPPRSSTATAAHSTTSTRRRRTTA